MRRFWTPFTALLAVAAFSVFLIQIRPSPEVRSKLVPCKILAAPHTYTCADGHVYIVHRGHWQDIGRSAPTPGVPKQ